MYILELLDVFTITMLQPHPAVCCLLVVSICRTPLTFERHYRRARLLGWVSFNLPNFILMLPSELRNLPLWIQNSANIRCVYLKFITTLLHTVGWSTYFELILAVIIAAPQLGPYNVYHIALPG